MTDPRKQFRSGVFAAAAAYFCWGIFPLFWKLLAGIASVELMAHRIVWCAVTVGLYLAFRGEFTIWRGVEKRVLWTLSVSALLLTVNWWVYIWAVNNGRIIEGSLGYFINPLVNVLFGVLFLRERLNRVQWLAVFVAACGVAYLTIQIGAPPWIALSLALSFGCYGLIRKIAVVDSARGLAIESAWIVLPALVFLSYLQIQSEGHFGTVARRIDLLMMASGPITAVPLLLFAYGARRIPLSLVGILQYIGPTLQFLSGLFIYHEPFSRAQFIGFALIWSALFIYAIDSAIRARRSAPT